MLSWLGSWLLEIYGPFRLLTSRTFLIGLGTGLAALATWWLLPRLWARLPLDRGRAHAVAAGASVGKPVGAGLVIIGIFAAACLLVIQEPLQACLLVIPPDARILGLLACVLCASLEGFLDDRAPGGWPELRIAIADTAVSLMGAVALCQLRPVTIWLPVLTAAIEVSPWIYVPAAASLLWLSINATNCTDGVDGLSGSLLLLALFYLGIILYAVIGHAEISRYLRVPHSPLAPAYAAMSFLMAGCLAGYLWHNAHPSAVLMGDAGSRPLGFLLGALVLATGNPTLIIAVAGVIFANGATGLVKLGLLRFFGIRIFPGVRYPLHDHARQRLGWSNTQVLLRFMLIQAVGTPLLLLLAFKVR
jgi:phospho-N-acetylmuramoyl-pentapeptide-transferase